MLQRLVVKLLLFQEIWVLVEGPSEGGEASVKLIEPHHVRNWLHGQEVLVQESVDIRSSIKEKAEPQTQFVRYGVDGWERYRLAGDSNIVTTGSREILIDQGAYSESGRVYLDRSGRPTTPIFRIRLPFERYVAHQLADSARILFNTESDRDHLQRSCSYPKLVLSATDDLYDQLIKALKKGSNVLQLLPTETGGEHGYISPPTDGVESATTVLEKKVKRFYDSAFRLYDSEGQKLHQTATGAAMERSSGLAAALAMVAETIADAENNILWFVSQAYSDRRGDWRTSVEWPTDYSSVELPRAA